MSKKQNTVKRITMQNDLECPELNRIHAANRITLDLEGRLFIHMVLGHVDDPSRPQTPNYETYWDLPNKITKAQGNKLLADVLPFAMIYLTPLSLPEEEFHSDAYYEAEKALFRDYLTVARANSIVAATKLVNEEYLSVGARILARDAIQCLIYDLEGVTQADFQA